MLSGSPSMVGQSSVAPTTHTSLNGDGSMSRISSQGMLSSRPAKQCEWCGKDFIPRTSQEEHQKRFCDRSCSARWRMRQPEILAKVHNPEVARKRGERKRAWFAAGSPKAETERERIRLLNPMERPEVRKKVSQTLRAMHHGPPERGGNGRGLTLPQQTLLDAIGPTWLAEFIVPLGPRTPGYPSHYKLDLANPERRIGIEVDGNSHYSRRALDTKKDARLASLGWIVLRFWNQDILTWKASGMPTASSTSMTLAAHGILPIP